MSNSYFSLQTKVILIGLDTAAHCRATPVPFPDQLSGGENKYCKWLVILCISIPGVVGCN